MKLSIVVMAAGLGTRMKSSLPKVLHPLSGHPMLYHILGQALLLSDDVHVVLFHQHEAIKASMNTYFSTDHLHFVLQDHANFPGTGGALMAATPKHDKVLVLNGDMPLVEAKDFEDFFLHDTAVVMSVFEAHNPFGYGRVIMDKNQHVKRIVEEKDASLEEKALRTVNAGVYLFQKAFLHSALPALSNANAQKEYYLTDLVEMAVNKGERVAAVRVDSDRFMGVNSKVHLAQAEGLMQQRLRHFWMEQGVSMRLPETVFIDSQATFEGECALENGVSILGKTHLCHSHIKAHSIIESSTIANSHVGPLARIRPGCDIRDSHIGNFVEVKNSVLKGVKAGHLSYLGDASIDEGTNVGCGTITCNYDGKAKHRTVIGKNVFIGSDTQLVAPVVIEDNVLIAAGTTVTQNVPSDALAISRAKLSIKHGFFSRFFPKKG